MEEVTNKLITSIKKDIKNERVENQTL